MQTKNKRPSVAIIKTSTIYPSIFAPPNYYPEFQNLQLHDMINEENSVFDAIREAFILLGFDKENINQHNWNPLKEIIQPGNTVLMKPNFVLHKSLNKGNSLNTLLTHPSIIFAILDYVILALKDKGKIIIGDAPIQEADFNEILSQLNILDTINIYRAKTKIKIEIIDFRMEMSINKKYREIQRIDLSGDPQGYKIIDLGNKSKFIEITDESSLFRVTNYDKEKMTQFHFSNHHAYVIAASALEADVIISLPKLKSHRKAGLTCALKNLIGINGTKDCLPHHRRGSLEEGGDEYLFKSFRKKFLSNLEEKRAHSSSAIYCFFIYLLKSFINLTEKIFLYKDSFKQGSWYGNKTIPRTLVDINYIINFASKNGSLDDLKPKRKFLAITDAVIGGEKEGPLHPTRKELGYIIISEDFLANDLASSYLVGFDPNKIPSLIFTLNSEANINQILNPEDIRIISNDSKISDIHDLVKNNELVFEPSEGWKGHIELKNEE